MISSFLQINPSTRMTVDSIQNLLNPTPAVFPEEKFEQNVKIIEAQLGFCLEVKAILSEIDKHFPPPISQPLFFCLIHLLNNLSSLMLALPQNNNKLT